MGGVTPAGLDGKHLRASQLVEQAVEEGGGGGVVAEAGAKRQGGGEQGASAHGELLDEGGGLVEPAGEHPSPDLFLKLTVAVRAHDDLGHQAGEGEV